MSSPSRISRIRAFFFSATGTTGRATGALAEQLSQALSVSVTYFNFTLQTAREPVQRCAADELAIVGIPVYAGRVPNVLLPYLTEKLRGQGTATIPVVLYGNRHYDDALAELTRLLTDGGFLPFAAAALIGEHAFSRTLAAGRPDQEDLELLSRFGSQITGRLLSPAGLSPVSVPGCVPPRPYYTPRDRAGEPVNILKVKPDTDMTRCTHCGLCAQLCPMGSISPDAPDRVPGICIKCCACVKGCPQGAKIFTDEKFLYHQHELESGFTRRAEPEFFLCL